MSLLNASKHVKFKPIVLRPPQGSTFDHFLIKLTVELKGDEGEPNYFNDIESREEAEQYSNFIEHRYSLYAVDKDGFPTHISDYPTPLKAKAFAKALGADADPFCLEDWAETHYEVVTRIYESGESPRVKEARLQGIGGCWQLAFDLTVQFGNEWGALPPAELPEWFETLERFLDVALNPPQVEPFDVTKSFESVADAFVYCHQYEYPHRCIEELAQYNIGTGEYGFACELLGYFK